MKWIAKRHPVDLEMVELYTSGKKFLVGVHHVDNFADMDDFNDLLDDRDVILEIKVVG